MKDFIAIDFETGNSKRVSACSIGYARVINFEIIKTDSFLIKPVGGHAPFQSKIHGIKDEHTFDKPHFKALFPKIKDIFNYPLVAHSLFDKQVLDALSDHPRSEPTGLSPFFSVRAPVRADLNLKFTYIDSCAIAQQRLPHLKDCKLKTLVKHFGLPSFKHHDAKEDAIACARVFIKMQNYDAKVSFPKRKII